jgi:penicillin-binding protein 1C
MSQGSKVMMRPSHLLRRIAIAASVASLLAIGAVAIETHRIGQPSLGGNDAQSVTVLDRNDQLLRAYTTADGKWRLPVAPTDVDPIYLKMLLAFEDRRFHLHRGVDPLSYLRIATEVIRHRKLISGGSTLTMQAARLLDGTHDKTARGKLRQMIRAHQLEQRLTKNEILALYLKLAPFGGNIEGARAASLAYFGKEPRRLSHAEAALLVALPQSPNARRPDRHVEAARRARDRVLRHAVDMGVISADELARALNDPVPTERRTPPQLAAHLADSEVEQNPGRLIHRTTLDVRMQAELEALARDHAKALGQGLSTALVVVDHASGEIRAEVGSAGFLDDTRHGAVGMTRAVRSPGSTLKPLIYGLAFDAGLAHPDTLIEDRPTRFGAYVPKNFDHDWHGTVTIREALAKSLNIPAVKALKAVGPQKLFGRLTALGIAPQLPKDAEPSLAMALGGVGMRATDLAALYAAIARGGAAVRVTHRRDSSEAPLNTRLMSDVAAWYLRDILKNAPPPTNARAGQIGYKTGTSYGYRDAWSAGFDGRHTIVAWVGRADGAPVSGLNGRQAAAPLLFDAFHRIAERRTPFALAPQGIIKGSAAELPPTLRRFRDTREDDTHAAFREQPLVIAFPPDRSEIDADPGDGEAITLKAEGGRLPLTWLVDGKPLPSDPDRREVALKGVGRGFIKLSVVDAAGRSDRVTVRLK